MKVRIGINGFGRIGRLALRAAWGWPEIEFAHINETKGGPEATAHLLEPRTSRAASAKSSLRPP